MHEAAIVAFAKTIEHVDRIGIDERDVEEDHRRRRGVNRIQRRLGGLETLDFRPCSAKVAGTNS